MKTLQEVTDVWIFETEKEQYAIEELDFIIGRAMKFEGTSERAYLRKLWGGESWSSVKEKLLTDGSAWYVWLMDGVHAHMQGEL